MHCKNVVKIHGEPNLIRNERQSRHSGERRNPAGAVEKHGIPASISITQRVKEIAPMVDETTATIGGTAETAHQLEQIAQGLKSQIARFKM